MVVDKQTGEVQQWVDNTEEIIQAPIRVTWDVREKSPKFVCDEGESEELSGNLLSATHLYACWGDQIGQPTCMGVGQFCPEHPDGSEKGIGLVLFTDQWGAVYMQCFGLMKNWAQGLVRRASKNESEFSTEGIKSINTKHGTMNIPRLAK